MAQCLVWIYCDRTSFIEILTQVSGVDFHLSFLCVPILLFFQGFESCDIAVCWYIVSKDCDASPFRIKQSKMGEVLQNQLPTVLCKRLGVK